MKLKQYPKYKDSESQWIGEVPEHWDVKPLRAMLKERNEKNSPVKTEQILSLSIAHGVTLYFEEGRGGNKAKSDLTAYKVAYPNDIVLNSMNVVVGAVGLSKYKGAISPVYYALYPRSKESNIYYYEKIFKNKSFQSYLFVYGKGILVKKSSSGKMNTIRMKISMNDLKGTPLPFPPGEEQEKIVKFLDWKSNKIAKFIRNKCRLIQLLKEQKQAIINQAVTRGINSNVKMKPSGIDWIGDIPEHWVVRRLKYLTKRMLQYGANESSGSKVNGDPRYVRITDIDADGLLRDETLCTISRDVAKPYMLGEGDILFARSGATVGKTFCYRNEWGESAYAGYLIRAKINRAKISHEYVYMFTKSNAYSNWILSSFIKATIQNISAEKYASLWFPLPPLNEQDEILLYIEKAIKPIDEAIQKIIKEIELIREYRTRMISDVVTGKADVRNIKVEDVTDEEITDDLDSSEDEQELDDSVEEVLDEE
ncbi:MAG: restriction endonuclease subunit S [Syntrophaceae bacterium]|nr:restriction endonuclease subunit S [Syntrophaceae bacterium]